MGADVIRVENAAAPADDSPQARALDKYLNRGKRRVALDWTTEEGRTLLDRLTSRCDILVTDLAPGELDSLNWESLGRDATQLIRCAVTPFGLSGPYRDWRATPATLLALGGYSYLMGDPGRAPLTMPGHYLEYQAGTFAHVATLAAHLGNAVSGRTIDISILETAATLSQFTTVMWTHGEKVRSRHGNRWENLHPITLYPCRDGWWYPNVVPHFWDPFTLMIGKPELAQDTRFDTVEGRGENWAALDAIVVEATKDKTMGELLIEGQETWRIPVGIALTLSDALADEHLKHRDFWQGIEDGLRLPASPYRFSGEPLPAEPPYAGAPEAFEAVLSDMEVRG